MPPPGVAPGTPPGYPPGTAPGAPSGYPPGSAYPPPGQGYVSAYPYSPAYLAPKKRSSLLRPLLLALAIVVVLVGGVAFLGLRSTSKSAQRAGFISGCTRQGPTPLQCGCLFDELDAKWGSAHMADVNRQLSNGGTFAESDRQDIVDAAVGCR